MAGPETEGPDGSPQGQAPGGTRPDGPADDVVRPGTGVVRPGTGVVRPGAGQGAAGNAGVVRPNTNPDGAAKAVASVPDTSEKPLEPIHVVLPVIPVKPAKQGFLDRLVAGKSEAEKAAEEARKEEEARRKAEQAERKAQEKARRAEAEARRKAAEKARKQQAEEERRAAEAEQKARAEAEEKARREAERAQREHEKAQREHEKAQREQEKARREQERALRQARDEVDEEDDDGYVEPSPARGPSAPPRSAPQGPPRPGPAAPARPGMPPSKAAPKAPGGPQRPGGRPGAARPMPDRGRVRGGQRYQADRYDDDRYGGDRYEEDRYRDDRYDDERFPAPRRRRTLKWVLTAVALIGLGGGSAAVAGAIAAPASVTYQPGIDTGSPAPILGRLDTTAPVPSGAGLDAALGQLASSPSLGPSPAVVVADAVTGQLLWQRNSELTVVPASATKVLTAAAVLATVGPNHRIATRVVAGPNPGDVVIIGGGDPTLSAGDVSFYRGAAKLEDLAEQVRASLGGTAPARVFVDGSLFSGSTIGPSGSGNVGVAVAHVTALMTDGARVDPSYRGDHPSYHSQPDIVAGRQFAALLGVPQSQVFAGSAPPDARVLGEVLSPPIASITEEMLAISDNTAAEMLARQVAIAKGMPASFAGGAAAVRQALADLGVVLPPGAGLADGSGLSRDNKVTAGLLVSVLLRAASSEHPELRSLVSGLAVAGYSGTLDDRAQPAGRGVVRAKTGTLTGVNSLVGYVVDADGRLLAFAAVANGTSSPWTAEPALDRLAAALATCGCR